MAKYIDKDKIAAEIEKMVKRLEDAFDNPSFASYEANLIAKGGYRKLKDILSLLDTFETKEVDLEKEFYDFLDTLIGKDNGHLSEDELFRIAEYFYELGLNTQRGE